MKIDFILGNLVKYDKTSDRAICGNTFNCWSLDLETHIQLPQDKTWETILSCLEPTEVIPDVAVDGQ